MPIPLRKHKDKWTFDLKLDATNFKEVYKWCWDTYGAPGSGDTYERRWDYVGSNYYIFNEKDAIMFILVWS